MENVNRAQDLIGNEIYDQEGNKIGKVGNVYVDDSTHQPEWVTVRTGMFGTRESFVPLQGASAAENRIDVGVSKDKIREAPRIEAEEGHLSDTEGRDLYTYYDLQQPGAKPREGGKHGMAEQNTGATEQGTSGTSAAGGAAAGGAAAGTQRARGESETTSRGDTGQRGDTSQRGDTAQRGDRSQRAGMTQRDEIMRRDETTQPEQPVARQRGASATGEDATEAMTRYEERLRVDTETVETGRVRLRKYVVTEQESTTVPLSHEEARIEREEIPESERRTMASGTEIGETEQEFILHEERPVLRAEPVPVERVRINTEKVTEERTVHGEVRREQFDIDDQTGKKQER